MKKPSPRPLPPERGDSIDDLTLNPSINLDIPGQEGGCRWHGFVKDGDAA